MMSDVAYWVPPDENPNFVSRPPDPGAMGFFKTIGWEALYHSPFLATKRFSEMTLEKSDYFNVAGRVLDPEEANQKYGLGGQLVFDEPIKEEAAQLMYRRKIDENDRAYLIGSGQTSGFRKVASFPVSMAASLIDPINFAAMFVPVVGEARIARMAQSLGGSALRQRLVQGALTGAGGAAMVEPFILLPALQDQSNYNLKDSAVNLGFGFALGGMLHAGLGAIGDRMRRLKPKDADALFEAAMNNVLKDEPVVAPGRVAEFVDVERGISAETQSALERAGVPPEQINNLRAESEALVDPMKSMVSYTSKVSVEPQVENLGELIGKRIDYEGYSGVLIRDEEGRFVLLREVTQRGEPQYIEIAGTGKDPNLLASDVGVFKKGTQTMTDVERAAQLKSLDETIRNEMTQREQNRGQMVNDNTKENSSSLPKDQMGMTGESAKDLNTITSETAEIEKALDLSEAERAILDEEIQADIGNTAQREGGISEGVKCIIRNLI